MIRELKRDEINDFIDFGDKLYDNDRNYVPFFRADLRKTIKKLVFEDGSYKALCSFDENGRMNARALLTIMPNKQLDCERCGYFSHFEIVNDKEICREFFDGACNILKGMGAEYIVGTFFPFDPDNRRGILVDGYEHAPMIFTSHNHKYYRELLESTGFLKLTDAYEYEFVKNPEIVRKVSATAAKSVAENDYHIDTLDLHNVDKDIEDVHKIMEIASTSINFEHVLSKEEMTAIFKNWKMFINPEYAVIARKNSDNSAIGFFMSLPDYFELFRMMKGSINLRSIFLFLKFRNKLSGVRVILGYVIPEYQGKGVTKALFNKIISSADKNGVKRLTLGTILEKNASCNGMIKSIGGELSRVYRIYYKQL